MIVILYQMVIIKVHLFLCRKGNICDCCRDCKLMQSLWKTGCGGSSQMKNRSTISSVQFSHSVMSDSLWPHGLQHTRHPCPSSTPRACSNSCPSSWWCPPTISSSVIPFSSCLQSFPASGSFPMSQFFESGGQNIGASASASVLPMSIQYSLNTEWVDFL